MGGVGGGGGGGGGVSEGVITHSLTHSYKHLSRWEFMYENTGVITKAIHHWMTGDKMELDIIYSQNRKEISTPIMISIFTQFIRYDLM